VEPPLPVIWMSAPGVHEMSTEPSLSTLDNKLVHILKATSVSGGPATPS
jgi:hypothetical protein